MIPFLENTAITCIPVMFIKPYRQVPRFAIGFTQVDKRLEPIKYTRTFNPEHGREVTVPFYGTTVTVPGDHVKPIKHPGLLNVSKVKIDKFTLDHIRKLEERPIIFTKAAQGYRETIPKSEIVSILSSIRDVFPLVACQGEWPQLCNPVITKLEFMGIQHIVPIVMQNTRGIMLRIYLTDITAGRNGYFQIKMENPAMGLRMNNEDTPPPPPPGFPPRDQARRRPTFRPPPPPRRYSSSLFSTYAVTITASVSDQTAVFDGGPLNISVPEAGLTLGMPGRKGADFRDVLHNTLIYTLKGDTICVE